MATTECGYDGLDPGIERVVRVLQAAGVETCQSCEGSPGHAYPEPTVDVLGAATGAGWAALAVCLDHGFPVVSLSRVWGVADGAVHEVIWRLVFRPIGHRAWDVTR